MKSQPQGMLSHFENNSKLTNIAIVHSKVNYKSCSRVQFKVPSQFWVILPYLLQNHNHCNTIK
jgi:hypothetical protein